MATFNQTPVPKVLRLEGAKLIAAYVGIPLLALLLAILVTDEIERGVPTLADALVLAPFTLLIPGLFLLLWMGTQRTTTLWPDRVEVFNGFVHRVFKAADIRGFRRERGAGVVHLVPKDAHVRPLGVPLGVLTARGQIPWLEALRNLARDDLAALKDEIESDERLGATAPARHAKLRRLRAQAKIASIGAWLIAAWIWLWPEPYGLALVVGALVPLVAVAISVRTHGFYRLDARSEDPRPSLAALFFAPTLSLFVRAIVDINGVDFLGPIVTGAVCAVALTLLILRADKRLGAQHWWIAIVAAGAFMLSLSALLHTNVQFDGARVQVFHSKIEDAYVTGGKVHLSELRLAPWGPFARPASANVPASFFDSVKQGDVVCVRLYDGALSWRWFEIVHCAR